MRQSVAATTVPEEHATLFGCYLLTKKGQLWPYTLEVGESFISIVSGKGTVKARFATRNCSVRASPVAEPSTNSSDNNPYYVLKLLDSEQSF